MKKSFVGVVEAFGSMLYSWVGIACCLVFGVLVLRSVWVSEDALQIAAKEIRSASFMQFHGAAHRHLKNAQEQLDHVWYSAPPWSWVAPSCARQLRTARSDLAKWIENTKPFRRLVWPERFSGSSWMLRRHGGVSISEIALPEYSNWRILGGVSIGAIILAFSVGPLLEKFCLLMELIEQRFTAREFASK